MNSKKIIIEINRLYNLINEIENSVLFLKLKFNDQDVINILNNVIIEYEKEIKVWKEKLLRRLKNEMNINR